MGTPVLGQCGRVIRRISKGSAIAKRLNTKEPFSGAQAWQCGATAAMWRECLRGGVDSASSGWAVIPLGRSPDFVIGGYPYSATRRRRSALPITDTELKVIAALAMIGLSSNPNSG
jgi:hypothetical protein